MLIAVGECYRGQRTCLAISTAYGLAELHAQARTETRQSVRDELERLALSYLRLADQADQNALIDVAYETPTRVPVQQQQQQIQAKDEDADK